jgi:hypothetical protein
MMLVAILFIFGAKVQKGGGRGKDTKRKNDCPP